MRTTITLDADVERLLKSAVHKHGKSFKVILNEAVRHSLGHKKKSPMPSLQPPSSMGLRAEFDPQRLSHLTNDLEAEAFISTTQRLKKAKAAALHDHS